MPDVVRVKLELELAKEEERLRKFHRQLAQVPKAPDGDAYVKTLEKAIIRVEKHVDRLKGKLSKLGRGGTGTGQLGLPLGVPVGGPAAGAPSGFGGMGAPAWLAGYGAQMGMLPRGPSRPSYASYIQGTLGGSAMMPQFTRGASVAGGAGGASLAGYMGGRLKDIENLNLNAYAKDLNEVTTAATGTTTAFGSMGKSILAGVSAFYLIRTAMRTFVSGVRESLDVIDKMRISAASMAGAMTTVDPSQPFEKSLSIAGQLIEKTYIMSRAFVGSARELQILTESMLTFGVRLDFATKKGRDEFIAFGNILKLITAGQNFEIQAFQEVRALMMGQNFQGAMLVRRLQAMGLAVRELVPMWVKQGTLVQNITKHLQGYAQATGFVQNTLQAQVKTLQSIAQLLMAGGAKKAYEDIRDIVKDINDSLIDDVSLNERGFSIIRDIRGMWDGIFHTVNGIATILFKTYPSLEKIREETQGIKEGLSAMGGIGAPLTIFNSLEDGLVKFGQTMKKQIGVDWTETLGLTKWSIDGVHRELTSMGKAVEDTLNRTFEHISRFLVLTGGMGVLFAIFGGVPIAGAWIGAMIAMFLGITTEISRADQATRRFLRTQEELAKQQLFFGKMTHLQKMMMLGEHEVEPIQTKLIPEPAEFHALAKAAGSYGAVLDQITKKYREQVLEWEKIRKAEEEANFVREMEEASILGIGTGGAPAITPAANLPPPHLTESILIFKELEAKVKAQTDRFIAGVESDYEGKLYSVQENFEKLTSGLVRRMADFLHIAVESTNPEYKALAVRMAKMLDPLRNAMVEKLDADTKFAADQYNDRLNETFDTWSDTVAYKGFRYVKEWNKINRDLQKELAGAESTKKKLGKFFDLPAAEATISGTAGLKKTELDMRWSDMRNNAMQTALDKLADIVNRGREKYGVAGSVFEREIRRINNEWERAFREGAERIEATRRRPVDPKVDKKLKDLRDTVDEYKKIMTDMYKGDAVRKLMENLKLQKIGWEDAHLATERYLTSLRGVRDEAALGVSWSWNADDLSLSSSLLQENIKYLEEESRIRERNKKFQEALEGGKTPSEFFDEDTMREALRLNQEIHAESNANIMESHDKTIQFVSEAYEQFFSNMAGYFKTLFSDALHGELQSLTDYFDAFTNIVRDMWSSLLGDMMAEWMKQQIGQTIQNSLSGLAGGGGSWLDKASLFLGGFSPTPVQASGSFAEGGVIPGGFVPIRAFAAGGIINRPTVGLVGEGGDDEAVIPLRGGAVPVKLQGKGEAKVNQQVANVTFNITSADVKDFDRLLYERKNMITGMIQQELRNAGGTRDAIRRHG